MASQAAPFLFQGEHLIVSSGNRVINLTNVRVIYDVKKPGASKFIDIPLDAVSCCALVTRSQPLLIIFAIIAGASSLSPRLLPEAAIGLGIAAIVLVVAYFATRRARLTISPKGGEEISVTADGMKREDILSFLRSVSEARNNYLQKIHAAASAQ